MVKAKGSFLPAHKTWRKLGGSPWAGQSSEEGNASRGTPTEVWPEGQEETHFKAPP